MSVLFWIVASAVIYCLVCWIICFGLVLLGRVRRDLGLDWILYAPLLPIYVLIRIVVVYEKKIARELTRRSFERKAKWIADELQKRGIKLDQSGFEDSGYRYYGYDAISKACEVRAELKPEQVEAYQELKHTKKCIAARSKGSVGGGHLNSFAGPLFRSGR